MPKKSFTINSFQDMYFDTRRNNSDWKLEPRNQSERTLSPVMRTKQLDDISTKSKSKSHPVSVVDKKQYGFLPNTDRIEYTVDNSGASGLGGSGQGSGMRETNTMPRVRVIPVRKPQNPNKEHNVEWLDKLSIRKAFTITANDQDGLWAVYQGRVYMTQEAIPHALWFDKIGLPAHGQAFDKVTRGYFIIDNNILRLVAYAPYGDMHEFDDYQNRILDKIGFEELYEEIKIVEDAYPRVSIKLDGSESSMLVPYRDYNDSFFKRVTPGEGHRPYMRHKEPGEGLSKIPVRDLPTKPFFMNSPKFKKKLRQPATPKKKSFSLSADIYDKAYKSLYKKFIGQLVAEHKDEVLRDAAEMWRHKGFSDDEVVSEWGALSAFLDKASKEQFIEVLKSYKRQLGEVKTSNSNGLDPAPYYGDTNVYPYKGTGPGIGPSSQLEVMLNPIQMRDTQVDNKQLTRILGDSKEAISYSEESLKKSLDELDTDTALQWIGNAGGKMKLLKLLNNLTDNFDVTMPQKAFDAIDEAYKRWKAVPLSRSLSGAKKSFKLVSNNPDMIFGLWAIYNNKVYTTTGSVLVHVYWFQEIGIPFSGTKFDNITRGEYRIEDNTLKIVWNEGSGNINELYKKADTLVDKISHKDLYEEEQIWAIGNSIKRLSKKSFKISKTAYIKKSFKIINDTIRFNCCSDVYVDIPIHLIN